MHGAGEQCFQFRPNANQGSIWSAGAFLTRQLNPACYINFQAVGGNTRNTELDTNPGVITWDCSYSFSFSGTMTRMLLFENGQLPFYVFLNPGIVGGNAVWRCPWGTPPTLRSYSINCWMGLDNPAAGCILDAARLGGGPQRLGPGRRKLGERRRKQGTSKERPRNILGTSWEHR